MANSDSKYIVLIVDDMPENIQVVGNILHQKGVNCSIAQSGRKALDIVAQKLPDLILLDIIMPDMDGFEVCERLKRTSETAKIPVIFVTVKDRPEDIAKGFEVGAVDYVTRPFNETELLSRVFTHLELKKTRDRITAQNQRLAEQNRELQELYALKEEYFSDALRKQAHELCERVKKLNCLYGISFLVEKPGMTSEEILQEIVELIPPAWQYPDITCARIVVANQEFKTENFRETLWKQSGDIIVSNEPVGTLEVCYLEEKPKSDEGSFLQEERTLLHVIAEHVGQIIECKRVEEKIRFQAYLLDSVEQAVIATDPEGTIIYLNTFAETLYGWSAEEAVGRTIIDLTVPQMTTEQAQDIMSKLKKGERWQGEFLVQRKDGSTFPAYVVDSPVYNGAGKMVAIVGVSSDITERKQAEEELRRLKEQLREENIYLREELRMVHNFGEIIGQSEALQYTLFRAKQVAVTDTTVLILGETGTGKELVARAIHQESLRNDRPLVKVNCAALPSHLIESELFGHEKGAFTGAIAQRLGRFELADSATIFLDEIGELPLDLQAKLLRVLQDGEFERLGSSRTIRVDVRVIAATNRNLEAEVQSGRFREDLFYRLNIYPLSITPLRERSEDIPLLVQAFVKRFSKKLGKSIERIPHTTMESLRRYAWPGNVRELQNVIERAIITAPDNILRVELAETSKPLYDKETTLEGVEREHIQHILEVKDWKIEGPQGAAATLGLHPSTLRFRMKKLGIKRP